MPKVVAKELIKIQRKFLWAGNKEKTGSALVKWEIIQRPKDLGGLGIENLTIKNASLLFKWWWRFFTEEKPLWKEIICSIHGASGSNLCGPLSAKSRGVWNDIVKAANMDDSFPDIIGRGFSIVVGRGDRAKFWHDPWLSSKPLKESFQRLFYISVQQDLPVCEMRHWDGAFWNWHFLWRRNLFAWEEELVKDMLEVIKAGCKSSPLEMGDSVRWVHSPNGEYSTKSFTRAVWESKLRHIQPKHILSSCWMNIAPLRVELLVWLVLQGSLNTKDRLAKIGLIDQNNVHCPICKKLPESVNHLFVNCEHAQVLWKEAMKWWHTPFPLPNDIEDLYSLWMGWKSKSLMAKSWRALFFVIIDQVWSTRNEAVFQSRNADSRKDTYLMKIRLCHWIKVWARDIHLTPSQILANTRVLKFWSKTRKRLAAPF